MSREIDVKVDIELFIDITEVSPEHRNQDGITEIIEDVLDARTDEAKERGIRLAHQSHTRSMFETVAGSIEVLDKIGREKRAEVADVSRRVHRRTA